MAIGSSRFIAEEIASICQSFLGADWAIQTQTTQNIMTCRPDTFYVCAKTQEAVLARRIPEGQRFDLELHPTTVFFLAIAGIPRGTTVHVFNNLLPYTELLIQECRDLGIDGLRFLPIAYAEMGDMEVRQLLREARYIIGVDRFLGKSVLQSPRYVQELRGDVRIIAGKRTASVATACRLVDAIVGHGYESIRMELAALAAGTDESKTRRTELVQRAETLIGLIRHASVQSVMTQVRGEMEAEHLPSVPIRFKQMDDSADLLVEQLRTIAYLRRKLQQLMTG